MRTVHAALSRWGRRAMITGTALLCAIPVVHADHVLPSAESLTGLDMAWCGCERGEDMVS